MATKTLNDVYLIDNSDNDVKVQFKIGAEDQKGKASIRVIGGTFNKPNVRGDLAITVIDTNKALHKKKLEIITTITDMSKKTNFTSLDITLTGGLNGKTYSLNKTVDAEGKSADYVCLIQFFDPKRKP